jgi:hypothetical protein
MPVRQTEVRAPGLARPQLSMALFVQLRPLFPCVLDRIMDWARLDILAVVYPADLFLAMPANVVLVLPAVKAYPKVFPGRTPETERIPILRHRSLPHLELYQDYPD